MNIARFWTKIGKSPVTVTWDNFFKHKDMLTKVILFIISFPDIKTYVASVINIQNEKSKETQKEWASTYFEQNLELNIILSVLYSIVFLWGLTGKN